MLLKIINLFSKKQRNYLLFILFLIFLTMLLETFTIVAFYPLIDSMLNPIDGEKNSIMRLFLSTLNFSAASEISYLISAIMLQTFHQLGSPLAQMTVQTAHIRDLPDFM